jgi:hypothetical protein
MGRLRAKLRNIASNRDGYAAFAHWCPGCGGCHVVTTKATDGPVWFWDGNADAPTCSPSIRLFIDVDKTICHYFLRTGNIEFCGDCAHKLSGQTVPLPDWPYADGEYGGVEP